MTITFKPAKRLSAHEISERECGVCGVTFMPKPYSKGLYCSFKCARFGVARATARQRGESQRDRGEGKTYRKRNGRHEHRVVAEELLGRPLKPGEIVHHRDGNRRNNHPDNLAVLPSQGAHIQAHAPWRQGSAHGGAKLTEAQVVEIRARRANGETAKSIARAFGITRQHVSHVVLHGWRHV